MALAAPSLNQMYSNLDSVCLMTAAGPSYAQQRHSLWHSTALACSNGVLLIHDRQPHSY
jgi:hypothetical protein